jgi:transcriptional regulator with XRE-family HTH domain
MSVQIINKGNSPEWAVLPYEIYLQLIEKVEMLEDIQDYDNIKASLENGEMETIPSEVVYSILDGDNPIKVWREYRGLSQQQLAKAAGISVPYVSQLETNKRKGSLDVLSIIAKILNLTIENIINENDVYSEDNQPQYGITQSGNLAKARLHKLPTPEIQLELSSSKQGRKKLANQYGINEERILFLIDNIDLFRINGIGSENIDLLNAVGVNSVIELSKCNAFTITENMMQENKKRKLVRRVPTLKLVESWISEAKILSPIKEQMKSHQNSKES